MNKTVRMIVTAPIAIPLIVLGWLLSLVWSGFGMLSLIGLWLMGIERIIA